MQNVQLYTPNTSHSSTKQRHRVDRLRRTHRLERKLAAEAESRVAEEVDGDDRTVKDMRRVNVWNNTTARLIVVNHRTVDKTLWNDVGFNEAVNDQAVYPLRNVINCTLPTAEFAQRPKVL